MTYKWYLLDWRDPQRVVVGELTNVHASAFPPDGDTNLEITPDGPDPTKPGSPDYRALLRGHGDDGQTVLECEINVGGGHQDHYENWVRTLINGTLNPDGTVGSTVTAQGVWVEDLGHGSKTELHPMDVVFGSVPASTLPGDWIGDLAAQHGLVVGQGLLAYRFAVASDDREGEFQSAPPLAPYTRPVTFMLPFPARPNGVSLSRTQMRIDAQDNAEFKLADPIVDADGATVLPVTVTCTAAYDDPAAFADDENPGVLTGEIVTYWSSAAQLSIEPTALTFGPVHIDTTPPPKTLRITNVGSLSVTLTVPPPPPPIPPAHVFPFSWEPVPTTTLSSGGVIAVAITFTPLKAGVAQSGLSIQSDAEGSPHHVTLEGTAIPGIDP